MSGRENLICELVTGSAYMRRALNTEHLSADLRGKKGDALMQRNKASSPEWPWRLRNCGEAAIARCCTMSRRLASLFLLALVGCGPTNSQPAPVVEITNPNPEPTAQFGRAVAMLGELSAIGVPGTSPPGDGRILLYHAGRYVGTIWAHDANLLDAGFGMSVDITTDRILVGAPYADDNKGAVAVYSFNGNFENVQLLTVIGHNRQTHVDIDGENWFGFDVDAGAGSLLAVCSVNANAARGKVEIFRIAGNYQSVALLSTVAPSTLLANDAFGHAVAIEDGVMAIGADKDDAGSGNPEDNFGAVYMFSLDEATGLATQTGIVREDLTIGVDLDPRDFFGASVDLDGGRLIVGAPGDDGPTAAHDERGTGAVYVYNPDLTLNTIIGKNRAVPLPLNRFDMNGYVVDFDGENWISGAPIGADNTGRAFRR